MAKKKYLIGLDPEIFIKDENNKLDSAIGLFGGTKSDPIDIGKGCAIQEDNILVEFNTPPTDDYDTFLDNINYCKSYIETVLAGQGKELHYSSSEKVTEDLLKDDKSREFGCAPSYNVVTEEVSEVNVESMHEDQYLTRSSGFHVHIGYENPTQEFNDRLVLCFELMVTLPLLEADIDNHNRRLLYGKLGDSREKEYGVECRSLGGSLLRNDDLIKQVWDGVHNAIKLAEESEYTEEELRSFILYCIDDQNNIKKESVNDVLQELKIKKLQTV